MAQGIIHRVQPSKSGKSLSVTVDASRYQAKLNSGLDRAVGQKITFDPSPQNLQDGTTIYWINEYTLSPGDHQQAPSAAPSPGSRNEPEATISGRAPSHYQPMVSNLAASLIAAGKGPESLNGWFQECKNVLEGKSEEIPY